MGAEREQQAFVSGWVVDCPANTAISFTGGLSAILPLLGGEGRGEVGLLLGNSIASIVKKR
jgi:hypothetical protein